MQFHLADSHPLHAQVKYAPNAELHALSSADRQAGQTMHEMQKALPHAVIWITIIACILEGQCAILLLPLEYGLPL